MSNESTISVTITATCAACGRALTIRDDRGSNRVQVEPCEACMESAYDDGRKEGAK